MKQNVYKQAMQKRVNTYNMEKGRKHIYILHFNSEKSSECILKYNIYTTFKEVVILLARTICS